MTRLSTRPFFFFPYLRSPRLHVDNILISAGVSKMFRFLAPLIFSILAYILRGLEVPGLSESNPTLMQSRCTDSSMAEKKKIETGTLWEV